MLERIIFGLDKHPSKYSNFNDNSNNNSNNNNNYNYFSKLSKIRTIHLTGDEIKSKPSESIKLLALECFNALTTDKDCGSVILGGAGLCSIVDDVRLKVKQLFEDTYIETNNSECNKNVIIVDSVADGYMTALNLI